uniref:Uncharacterized protein n=1 Tax=Solanum tuberosum TaxID=4113 RepID=M1C8D2_SOLTU
MTSDQKLFKDLDRSFIFKVKIGNGEYLDARGRGTVAIESLTGLKLIVDVLFVPNLDQNLLSVGQLLENGLKMLFEEKACVVKDADNKEMFKVKMRGKSFALNLLDEEQVAVIKLENNSELWHKRLRYFHHDAILFMKENQLAEGLPSLEKNLPACEACQYGKQTRLPFQNSSWRAKQKLQLIHTNVGGPQKTPYLKGSKYYIAFIDDCTRYCWIYF